LTIAVVDRVGKCLRSAPQTWCVGNCPGAISFRKEPSSQAGEQDAVEVATSVAHTGAFFSHNEAPLSSRTVRFISGIHFPPGISFTPSAALYASRTPIAAV